MDIKKREKRDRSVTLRFPGAVAETLKRLAKQFSCSQSWIAETAICEFDKNVRRARAKR